MRRVIRKRGAIAAFSLGAALLLGLYAFAAFRLSDGVDIERYPSGIFDLDVGRVVDDWATPLASDRTTVHPLYKLILTPLGMGLRRSVAFARDPLDAARVLAVVAMTLNALLVGWLAVQLTRGAWTPGVLATLVCGASFSSVLLAAVPDAASISCLSTVAPLLYLNARLGRPFRWSEALGWALLGVFCIAFTLTQIVHWGIALGTRAVLAQRDAPAPPSPALLARHAAKAVALIAAVGVASWAGASVQSRVYPYSARFYDLDRAGGTEASFLRFDSLRQTPLRHGARLASHFLGTNFVAPFPGYSDFLVRGGLASHWSLSIEEPGAARWHPAQLALLAVVLAFAVGSLFALRRGLDRRFVAPLLAVASQFALHLVYGREYILYSPNWHGALTAVLVAACWNALGSGRRWFAIGVPIAALGMAINSVAVLDRVYAEVDWGLETERRDASGLPKMQKQPASAAATASEKPTRRLRGR